MKHFPIAALLTVAFAASALADDSPLVVQAEASIKQVRYDVAVELLNRAIAANPRDARAYSDRAYAYLGERDFNKAFADCHTAIELDGASASAYGVLANINWITGHNDDAATDFDEALHLRPTDSVLWFSRGFFYLHRDNNKAIDDLTQAIRINPKYEEAYYDRGNAYLDGHQYDSAINDISAAIALKPDHGNLYHERAFAYQGAGKLDAAIADYTKSITLKPDSDVEYYSRGYAYAEAHNYPMAVQDFTTAIRINPKNAGYYFQRGHSYLQLGDQAHATADLQQAQLLKSQAGN
jgi:Flp pilus assembly protein TadD